jgi:hypothetical protein
MTRTECVFRARFRGSARAAGCLVALLGSGAAAQSGIVGGTVYRDTLYHQLTAVEITIPALNRRTVSNYAGDFRFTAVPAGKYAVQFRHVGFAPLTDTVVVADNAPVDREYIMAVQAVTLDSVRVTAPGEKHRSPGLTEFTERLKNHNGGYFMDETVLRKNDSRRLQDLLPSLFPGLRVFRPVPKSRPTFETLSSGRGTCNGPAFSCGAAGECPVALYVDGHVVFNPGTEKDPNFFPDYTSYATMNFAGVEYYPGGASIPPQYNATTNTCGVLLLWSRDR